MASRVNRFARSARTGHSHREDAALPGLGKPRLAGSGPTRAEPVHPADIVYPIHRNRQFSPNPIVLQAEGGIVRVTGHRRGATKPGAIPYLAMMVWRSTMRILSVVRRSQKLLLALIGALSLA